MVNRQGDSNGNYQKTSNGQFGHRFLTSAAASPEGEYYGAIEAWSDSVISYDSEVDPKDNSISTDEFGGETSQTALTITEGKLIAGSITNIVVTSGKIIAYLK
tara:strand:- start:68164 stop:68472 length:309 start_codon:yes stop_codon:yes gene_type:complete